MHKMKIVIGVLVVLALVLAMLPACESAAPTATAKPAAPTAAAAATPTKAAATTPAAPVATPTAVIKGDSTGVTDTQITLGTTGPLSGPVSVAGTMLKAWEAYYKYVNDQGGINGRKVVFKLYDDAYTPAKTIEMTKQAVEDDKVFAMAGSVGTAAQIGVIDYLNGKKVPQLFVASGDTAFAADPKKNPWSMGGAIPIYADEAVIYAKYILANKPNAKVGIIYQNDSMGKAYLTSFKAALGAKAATTIVGEQAFEVTSADMSSQLQNLKSAGTDLLWIVASQTSAKILTNALAMAWFPEKILASSGSGLGAIGVVAPEGTKGILSTAFYKDPSDPSWENDAGMKLHKEIMAKYYPDGKVVDAQNIFAMSSGWVLQQVLMSLGKDVTRENLMKGVTNMNFANSPFLLPGITVKTTPTDVQPIRAQQLIKFNGTRYELFGSIIDARS